MPYSVSVVKRPSKGPPGYLSKSIEPHKKVFSDIYVSMIRAGEVGGILDVIPAQQWLDEESWYSGTANAVYQGLDILEAYQPGLRLDGINLENHAPSCLVGPLVYTGGIPLRQQDSGFIGAQPGTWIQWASAILQPASAKRKA